MSRVGSGRVKRFENLAGRFGSRGFEISRVGSGQEVLKPGGSGRVVTREILVTRGSRHHDQRVVLADLRIETADLACGLAFFKLIAACQRTFMVVPAPRELDPQVRPTRLKMIQNLPNPARKPPSPPGDTPTVCYHSVQKIIPGSNFSLTRHEVLLRECRVR